MNVKVRVTKSCPTLCDPMGLYSPRNSLGQNTGMGNLSLLQGIFPTQGLKPGMPHCRWILYQLSHKGSPRILQWVAYPFCSGSSRPRNRTRVSCTGGGFFTQLSGKPMREGPSKLLSAHPHRTTTWLLRKVQQEGESKPHPHQIATLPRLLGTAPALFWEI